MTVYVDIVILENLLMNFIILYATSIIGKNQIRYIRICVGSAIGSIYAVLEYITNIQIFSNILLKVILSIVIVYIVFKPARVKLLLKQLLFFYLTSFVFGGVALCLLYFINPNQILTENGFFLGAYALKTILLGGILGLILIFITFKFIKGRISAKDIFCNITIKLYNKEIRTKALIDTGNLLKEPISNIPVIIVERILLYDILPKEILNNLENILNGDFSNIPEDIKNEYIPKLKLIPFSSLGKENGMLLGIKADGLEIENENDKRKINNIVIGIYDKSLTKRGEYQALLGLEI